MRWSRRGGSRRWFLGIVLGGGLVLAVLAPPPPVRAVPFVDLPLVFPRPQLVAEVIRTPPCQPQDLAVEMFQKNGFTGGATRSFRFTNRAEEPCSLAGRPKATAMSDGQPVAVTPPGGAHVPEPKPPRDLQRGHSAILVLTVTHLCDEAHTPGAPRPVADEVVFHLDAGDLSVPLRIGVTCGFGVTEFGAVALWVWPEVERLDTEMSSLPARARPGEEISFVGSVTNNSPGPVSLQPCPGHYIEFRGPGGVKLGAPVRFALNCDTIRMIEVGQTVPYEVRATIPPEAKGRITVQWSLDLNHPATGQLLVEP